MKRLLAGTLATVTLGAGGTFAADQAVNPYEDKGTHHELPIVADFPQGERVEIHKDKAQMDLVGWNDEYRISIIPQIPTASFGAVDRPFAVEAERPFISKRMEYRSGDVTAFIEPKEGTDDEFDIDFTLHSKPDTNVFTYKIEGAEEFDFFYQPALTQEEIDEGASRPENVVGSYAVYHKSKANHHVGSTNYAAGKAFHIYRPKAIDTNGAEVWAELHYENRALSVTVPQKFLDEAVYPVKVDPTFGYTTIGASTLSSTNDLQTGSHHTLPENGDLTHISQYNDLDTNDDGPFQLGIYNHSTAAYINNSAAVSSPVNNDWNTVAVTASLSSGEYWLIQFGEEIALAYDTGASNIGVQDLIAYPGTWQDPLDVSSLNTRLHSIYATYTASAAAPTTITPKTLLQSGQLLIQSGQMIVQ